MSDVREHVIHCFAERLPDGQWQAFSIQFGLAAQGDSWHEVRAKLLQMIQDYLEEAISGVDSEFRRQLLSRKATLRIRAKYLAIRILGSLRTRRRKTLFDEWFEDPIAC